MIDFFLAAYGAKYDKAVECLVRDRDRLLSFYDFPAERWKHIRSTNPIESSFATVRLRTTRTKGCLSRKTALAIVFKLCQSASKKWRRLDGSHQTEELLFPGHLLGGEEPRLWLRYRLAFLQGLGAPACASTPWSAPRAARSPMPASWSACGRSASGCRSLASVCAVMLRARPPGWARVAAALAAMIERPDAFDAGGVDVSDAVLAPGYGRLNEAVREAMALAARHEGLLLDPVYTAKAMAGLIAHVRSGRIAPGSRVLFVHTGGQPALFAYADSLGPCAGRTRALRGRGARRRVRRSAERPGRWAAAARPRAGSTPGTPAARAAAARRRW